MLAPIVSKDLVTVASKLNLRPPVTIKWYGLDNFFSKAVQLGAASAAASLGFIASTQTGLGYLFNLSLVKQDSDVVLRLVFMGKQNALSIWGAEPVLIQINNDIDINLASLFYGSITRDTAVEVEFGANYMGIRFAGTQVLRTSLPSTYVIDTLKTFGEMIDRNGSIIQTTALSFVDTYTQLDATTVMNVIIPIAVVAAVAGLVALAISRIVK